MYQVILNFITMDLRLLLCDKLVCRHTTGSLIDILNLHDCTFVVDIVFFSFMVLNIVMMLIFLGVKEFDKILYSAFSRDMHSYVPNQLSMGQ